MNDSAISVAVIAKRLDVCERTARRIIEAGDLKAHRIRRQWRVFEADFQEYLIHFIAAQAVHAQEPQVPAANALARIRAAFRYGAAMQRRGAI